jgi:integrase/recombinase XerD
MSLPARSAVLESNLVRVETGTAAVAIEPAQLHRNPVAVFLSSLSPGSRRTMLSALKIIATMVSPGADAMSFPWASLDYAHTAAIRTRLAESFAPATANKLLAALRGTLKMSFRLGLISADQMTRASSFDPVRGSRVPRGRSISQGELRALFGICDPSTNIGARDAALLGLLYAGGLRRAEVVTLDLEHLDLETGAILVNGKGSKQRRIFVVNGALDAVKAWLQHRGGTPGPLLLPVKKGGHIVHRRMTDAALAERVRHLAKRAGVSTLSPHDFRRSFVGEMLDLGADLATVQQMAGHASPTTTSKYDRRGDRTKRRAAGLLHVPFVGKSDR